MGAELATSNALSSALPVGASAKGNFDNNVPVKDAIVAASPEKGSSVFSAAANLISVLVGSGILALSYSLQRAGVALGSFILVLSAALTLYGFYLLNSSCRRTGTFSFRGLAKQSIGDGAVWVIESLSILSSLGYCACYVLIAGDVAYALVQELVPNASAAWNATAFKLLFGFVIMMPLSMFRYISGYAFFSYIALICIAYTLILVVVYGFMSPSPDADQIPMVGSGISVCLCIPVFALAFGASPAVPPLYSEIKGQSFKRIMNACTIAIVFCTVAYLFMGICGLYSAGPTVSSNVLLTLPKAVPVLIARIGFVYVVCVSFPMMFFPARVGIYSFIFTAKQAIEAKKAAKAAKNAPAEAAMESPAPLELAPAAATPAATAAALVASEGSAATAASVIHDESTEATAVSYSDAETLNAGQLASPDEQPSLDLADLETAGPEGKEALEVKDEVWFGWWTHVLVVSVVSAFCIMIACLVETLSTIAGVLGAVCGTPLYFGVAALLDLRTRWLKDLGLRAVTDAAPGTDVSWGAFCRWMFARKGAKANILPDFVLLITPILVVIGVVSTFLDA